MKNIRSIMDTKPMLFWAYAAVFVLIATTAVHIAMIDVPPHQFRITAH